MSKEYILTLLVFLSALQYSVLAQPALPTIKIEGEVIKKTILHTTDIDSMKRTTVRLKDFSGREYFYSGVSVQELLKHAGVSFNKEQEKENLQKYILIKSADGSEILFSFAEIDSTFTDLPIILSDKINNKHLPEGLGPFRLVVPGEENRTRWIWAVNRIIVGYVKE